LALKKYIPIEGRALLDSTNHCEITTGRDNEFFWTEKFIVSRLCPFNASTVGLNVRFTPILLKNDFEEGL
jgi:hypothetical protein